MIHDPNLLAIIDNFPTEAFEGEVFRATRLGLEPRAFSTRGGRWARNNGASALYTSLEREGALAEISFHLSQLSPRPSKPIIVHKLEVTTKNTKRLDRAALRACGLDLDCFGEINYLKTQEIGEAVAFLECDALIVPSARWDCDNLILYNESVFACEINVVESEEVDWIEWTRQIGDTQLSHDQ